VVDGVRGTLGCIGILKSAKQGRAVPLDLNAFLAR
jgi:hypothetical protein